ncbi:hypothetical protein ACFQLX_01415 [Streptomyces polyrhachis]|uniref:Secreted protein n=1 Tax=Streptomyces polyrhachis TaxID=1282885 RepID=A0ABW2GAB6_9ACTN
MKMPMRSRLLTVLASAAAFLAATTTTAGAQVVKEGSQFVFIYAGGYRMCTAALFDDGPNTDVRGQFEAHHGGACQGWLERRRDNPDGSTMYGWTRVSDYYFVPDNWAKATGAHWNGTGAGSRVCIILTSTGEKGCTDVRW